MQESDGETRIYLNERCDGGNMVTFFSLDSYQHVSVEIFNAY